MDDAFRSGFAVLLGRPNVGKSTLLNRLVGRKLAIVSEKPQTTRHRIAGVLHGDGFQVVFLDTPGVHRPRHRLGEYMLAVARRVLKGVDVVVFVAEADPAGPRPGDREAAALLGSRGRPALLVLNKWDLVPPRERKAVREWVAPYLDLAPFAAYRPVSARTGEGVEVLVRAVRELLPPGPPYFPVGVVTDQPERVLMAEIIREKILELTREEVPHSVAVQVEQVEERGRGLVYVGANIYVEKESQRGILIGRGGRMLKEIGTRSRLELEDVLEARVYLDMWVKVKEGWRDREGSLQTLGFRLD